MGSYESETIDIAVLRAEEIKGQFLKEVRRLLATGAIDREHHDRRILFGVALQNITDGFMPLGGSKEGREGFKVWNNLRRF